MKHWIGMLTASVLIVALGTVGSNATPLPQHSPGDPVWTLDPGPGVLIQNSFDSKGTWTDEYDFIAGAAGTLGAIVAAFNQLGGSLHIDSIKLFDTTSGTPVLPEFTGPADFASLSFSGLIGGHQFALLVSTTTCSCGGSYIGKLQLSTVPLPPSLPLAATGLGVLAFVMFRRRLADIG